MDQSHISYRTPSQCGTDSHDDAVTSTEDADEDDTSPLLMSPASRSHPRGLRSCRTSDVGLRSRITSRITIDESAGLLEAGDVSHSRSYASITSPATDTPRPRLMRSRSGVTSARLGGGTHHQRTGSFGYFLTKALSAQTNDADRAGAEEPSSQLLRDDRGWYDQFTSTDWVRDSIADAYRMKVLRSRKDIRGKLLAWFDGAQGWTLVAIIGCLTALVAYVVDVTETVIFDYKFGHCTTAWYLNRQRCCDGATICDAWVSWSSTLNTGLRPELVDYGIFTGLALAFAASACVLTLRTKTVISSHFPLTTLDENLGAENRKLNSDVELRDERSALPSPSQPPSKPPMAYYSAAGSGVAEVKVILSGFVLHGYLGLQTLVLKTLGLILSVSSGLSLGKEGPYVHIATCIGNIACRMFNKYHRNDAKRREVLSASAASGVAVAFGAPIGGVLFSLEEVSYYFPPKTLFRTFFCCIAAALSLKFLDPYGTRKIVLFEVRYLTDWKLLEMVAFVLLGILGGLTGAIFIKACRFWARTFRRIPAIRKYPLLEVSLVALATGLASFWNRYTNLPVTELLFELASPCQTYTEHGNGLCPTAEHIPHVIWYLSVAFIIKVILTIITFGIKVPAGIYVPAMVMGGLLGRIVGHAVQWLALNLSAVGLLDGCSIDGAPESCVVPGVYAMVAAGATMCGVTRLSVTLAVILFELTGSLDHVLPFSIGVLVSKWTADALEPLSIYDLLTDMNSYPFLDNKVRPLFTSVLGDITPRVREERVIDISRSSLVPATALRAKVDYLHMSGELDGGLPIVRDGILVGLIPAPDLEFALDQLDNEDTTLCLMASQVRRSPGQDPPSAMDPAPADFTTHIDLAPLSLDILSPMDLVYECFVKLGLRYICVLRDGRYAGLVHKKAFVRYCKELEER